MVPPSEPAREDGKGGLEAALGGASSQFRRRLGAGAVVVVTLVVGISTLLAWRQYDDEKQKALVELQARAALASTVFDTYFAGQLALLSSVAAAPAVVDTDQPAMKAYFMRLENGKTKTFTGGIAWIDRQGVSRISTNPRSGAACERGRQVVLQGRRLHGRPVRQRGPCDAQRQPAGGDHGGADARPLRPAHGSPGRSARASRVADRPAYDRPGLRRPHHPRPRSSPGDAGKLRAAQERRHPSPHQERQGCAHRCQRPRRLEWARRCLRQLQGAGLDVGDRPSRCDRVRACPQQSPPRARGHRRARPWLCCASSAGLCCAHDGSRRPSGSRSGSGTSSLSRSATHPPRARSRKRSELHCRPRSRRRG